MKRLKAYSKSLLSKIRSETADSVTIFIITSMILLFFVVGWTIDTAKNASVRADLNDIAQEAVQAATRVQDGNGNLKGQICTDGVSSSWSDGGHGTRWLEGQKDIEAFYTANYTKDPAIALVAKSYEENTGRGTWTTGKNTSGLFETGSNATEAQNARQGNYIFVRNMRTMGFSDVNTSGNYLPYDVGADSKYRIKITCSNGLYYQGKTNSGDVSGDKIDDATNNNKVSTGSKKINTITIEVQDWTSNFFLGMFNGWIPNFVTGDTVNENGVEWKNPRSGDSFFDFSYQTFRIQQSAITSWSSSAIK